MVKRQCNNVLFAFNDGFSQGPLRGEVSRLPVRNESIAVAHKQQIPIEVDPIEGGNFG